MAEELDTPAAPPEVIQDSDAGAEIEATPTEPTPEEPPPQLTPEQIIEQASEKAFQKIASWQGRRDKDLFDNLGSLIETKISSIKPPSEPAETSSVNIFDDPDKWAKTVVPKILSEEVNKRTRAEKQFTSEVIKHAGSYMDTDPLFEDKEFGKEVISEIQKGFSSLQKNLPPKIAAKLLISDAMTNVYRKKSAKSNALSGNKPANTPIGTISPPTKPANKATPVKLSDSASKLAKRWGYSPEELAKVFKE